MINDKIYINNLLDFYESLLTNRQLEILNLYYRKDYSMSEVAETLNISKAAISEAVRNTVAQIIKYEEKLKLFQNFQKRLTLYQNLEDLNNEIIDNIVKKLKEVD